jgi:hypothetical protein
VLYETITNITDMVAVVVVVDVFIVVGVEGMDKFVVEDEYVATVRVVGVVAIVAKDKIAGAAETEGVNITQTERE